MRIGLGVGVALFLDQHRTMLFVSLLIAIFLYGYFEGAVFKHRDWACATWIIGLLMLTAWIVYPATMVRIGGGIIVFVSGVALMTIYYRRRA
jgi:sorbitol-specific phosphotransferase system component IIBC